MRKQNEPMLNLLGRFVVTMFTCAYTTHSSDEQQKEKLEKLRSIWEAQRYFSDDTLKVYTDKNGTIYYFVIRDNSERTLMLADYCLRAIV